MMGFCRMYFSQKSGSKRKKVCTRQTFFHVGTSANAVRNRLKATLYVKVGNRCGSPERPVMQACPILADLASLIGCIGSFKLAFPSRTPQGLTCIFHYSMSSVQKQGFNQSKIQNRCNSFSFRKIFLESPNVENDQTTHYPQGDSNPCYRDENPAS